MNGQTFLILLLILINLIYGISREKSRRQVTIKFGTRELFMVHDLFALILVITLIVIACNTLDIPDIEGYKMFYSGMNTGIEPGYVFLENLGIRFGLSFETFRSIFIVGSYLVLWIAVDRLKLNKNIVFALYSVYPFTYDVIQLRNLLALSLVVLGISFLYTKDKGNKVKYVICIALATLFHSLMLIYLVLLVSGKQLIDSRLKKQLLGLAVALMFVFSILMSRSFAIQSIIGSYFYSFNSVKADAYLRIGMRYGFIVFWFMEIFYVLVAYINKKNSSSVEDEIAERKELSFWIMITVTVLGCPLCILNSNFYRIFRNISVLNYGQLQYSVTSKKNYLSILGIVLFVLGFALNAIYELNINPEGVLYPFLGVK